MENYKKKHFWLEESVEWIFFGKVKIFNLNWFNIEFGNGKLQKKNNFWFEESVERIFFGKVKIFNLIL